jgi:hypothetical protein
MAHQRAGRLWSSGERRQHDLDCLGICEPDQHTDWMADQQLPLPQYAAATGELEEEDLEDRSLVLI